MSKPRVRSTGRTARETLPADPRTHLAGGVECERRHDEKPRAASAPCQADQFSGNGRRAASPAAPRWLRPSERRCGAEPATRSQPSERSRAAPAAGDGCSAAAAGRARRAATETGRGGRVAAWCAVSIRASQSSEPRRPSGDYCRATPAHTRHAAAMGKKCEVCKKKCSGDVLKANDKYFHIQCFQCKQCSRPLGESGFYTTADGSYLCPEDYRALGRGATHQSTAPKMPDACSKPTAVNGQQTINSVNDSEQLSPLGSPSAECAACDQPLHSGQVLLALGQSWHVYCFKCSECGAVLHGEYMSHDGKPLCLRDYNERHGVKCYECHKFIAGKVLQAGGYKFHPTCARCSRCGLHFGDGEEMYMQGDEIWHPSCEHSRTTENIAPSAKSASLSSRNEPKYQSAFGQHLTYMYLLPEAEQTYLRHPITNPKEPNAPQFHVPQGPIKIRKSRLSMLKTGMQRLTEDLEKNVPRPKSPHMDNEEPIEMAHYPAGHAPDPDKLPAIERDDFPAPPYPYAVEELKRRLSTSSIENEISDDELSEGERIDEDKLKKTVEQLEKFDDSSIAHVIKQNIEESHKKQRLPLHWDPRNASRTPSAKKMPHLRFRYDVPINASPSRHLNRPRPWVAWQGGERAQGNTLPCFHVPESRGSTMRAATLPTGYNYGTLSMENLDTTISSQYSDHSAGTMGGMRTVGEMRSALRSSLPDMSKPAKIYDLAILQTTNKKLPEGVDRQHLERHLARDEFERLFEMSPIEFYKLPEWKRINLKRKHKLF